MRPHDPDPLEEPMPASLRDGLRTASRDLGQIERWIPRLRGPALVALPRLVALSVAAARRQGDDGVRRMVRGGIVRILSYLRADIRLSIMMDLARHAPDALDDLLLGAIEPSLGAHRYNLLASLGVFVRHSLIEEVITTERLRAVSRADEGGDRQD